MSEIIDISKVYEQYRANYLTTHPKPQKREYEKINYPFTLFYIILFCLAVFASIRTGTAIHEANVAEGIPVGLSIFMAIAGVVGIEGLILSHAIFRVRTVVSRFSGILEFSSIILGISISIGAGAKFSAHLIQNIPEITNIRIEYVLSILLVVGFTLILCGYGEFLGNLRHMDRWNAKYAQENFEVALSEYDKTLLSEWETSDERQVALHDINLLREQSDAEIDLARLEAKKDAEILRRVKNKELREVTESDENLSKTFRNLPKVTGRDYRRLSVNERKELLTMNAVDVASHYQLSDRTARNWISNARREYGHNQGSE